MKHILAVLFLCLLSWQAQAQVKFDLAYNTDTKVYTVRLLPEVSWVAPKNMVASAQVVLRVGSDQAFTPAITSLVDGLIWADNAYIENPDGAAGYTFVCISIVNPPTSKIALVSGEPIPLFSFVNAAGSCAGEVTLLDNGDPMVKAVRAGGFNVTQHLAVLGAGGNAFRGVENGTVDCSPATGVPGTAAEAVDEVSVSPVPADQSVRLSWNLVSGSFSQLDIVVCDALGREVFREPAGVDKGRHTRQIAVEHWPEGLYRIRFASRPGYQSRSWNMMVVHR